MSGAGAGSGSSSTALALVDGGFISSLAADGSGAGGRELELKFLDTVSMVKVDSPLLLWIPHPSLVVLVVRR